MAQKPNLPKSEYDLRITLDWLYEETRKRIANNELPRFQGLLELASSEITILTAIHKIKANRGANTPGSDKETMAEDILQKDYTSVIERVRELLHNYKAHPVRRKFIPKPGKKEMRPLGIPTVIDRIIQECIRIVIEPILEAQFFKHSYGFRPMRDAHMAIERTTDIIHKTGYHWVVEGDISKFFDKVNHTILLKRLWHLGIRDRRVLMVIKQMLRAGIMGELRYNELGTPQGGIISPLLANAYLDAMDQWITREWENKKTRFSYKRDDARIDALRKRSNLKPAYLIRYADDWVLVTNSKANALRWKHRIAKYLAENLKLQLSEEKTLITDVRKKAVKFLGIEIKFRQGKSRKGLIPQTKPDRKRLKAKIDQLKTELRFMRRKKHDAKLIDQINRYNSAVRGVIQYYQISTHVAVVLSPVATQLRHLGRKALGRHGGKLRPANETNNLTGVHSRYSLRIPTIEYQGMLFGLTDLSFANWSTGTLKNPDETPYTPRGRELYIARTGKKTIQARADDLLSLQLSKAIAAGQVTGKYNFEYFLNRAYAFNRDRGKCRVCGKDVESYNVHTHHTKPRLPIWLVNKVVNLATVHDSCHWMIHSDEDYSHLGEKVWKKILSFREKLTMQF